MAKSTLSVVTRKLARREGEVAVEVGAAHTDGAPVEAEDQWQPEIAAHREAKKKPKAAGAKPKLESLLDSPPQSTELIRPKRKPRTEKEEPAEE